MTMHRTRPSLQPLGTRAALVDGSALDQVRALLGAARLDQLLGLFEAQLVEAPSAISVAVADCDFPAASAEALRLHRAAAGLGAPLVAAAALDLHGCLSATHPRPRQLVPALGRLSNDARRTSDAIRRARRRAATGRVHA